MANERLFNKQGDQGYIPFAYAGYACTIDLYETVRGGKSANALRGLLADEVERWGEVALYRNALMSVRYGNTAMALNSLRAYQAHAGRWPADFRETQQLVISRIYLRLLNMSAEKGGYSIPPQNVAISKDDCRSAAYQTSVVAAIASRATIRDFESERGSQLSPQNGSANQKSRLLGGATSRTTSSRRPTDYRGVLPPGGSFYSNEFLTIRKAAADTIARSNHFPRAGETNHLALDLADEMVRGWQLNGERDGDWADEMVETLYLLSRVTFHSQRILRYLFVLLVASENYEEAKLALKLYIQIVDKAREGDAAELGGKIEEEKMDDEVQEGPANGMEAKEGHKDKQSDRKDNDHDSDEDYVNTLLHGVHVYAKYLHDAHAADELARKVIDFVDGQDHRTLAKDFTLWAKVKRMAGVARAALCAAENNAATRTVLHEEALSLLKQSINLDDQSSETFYALAYLQSEMLDSVNSIRMARRAVELEPANVENWHLLTLLLSSQKDYKGALNVAEEGLGEAEDDDEADSLSSKPTSNGVYTNGNMDKSVSSRTLLLSVDYPPRGTERAQSILRLMMTHNALEEVVEGGLAAIEGQREIFEFFHRRVGLNLLSSGTGHKITVPGANGPDIQSRKGSLNQGRPTTTVLGGAVQGHSRFHSLTGLGQSGSQHHLLPIHSSVKPHHTGEESHQAATSVGAPMLVRDQEASRPITGAQIRQTLHVRQETFLLASLWLMSAATFRRNGKLTQCRVAIQEAERVDPGEAEVWVQLALWFEQQPGKHGQQPAANLSIQCLYKALACKGDHVGATIHLARIFLSNPTNPSLRDVQQAIANVASPLPQTTDNVQASHLASELISHTQSRRITASSAKQNIDGEDRKKSKDGQSKETTTSQNSAQENSRLATTSLAEGLLYNLTQGNGWNVSEAWLFLARVMKETNRLEKQREYLEFALQLEKAKTIRPLPIALNRL
jgi:tetratricopeptide (TPR) repeat protein